MASPSESDGGCLGCSDDDDDIVRGGVANERVAVALEQVVGTPEARLGELAAVMVTRIEPVG